MYNIARAGVALVNLFNKITNEARGNLNQLCSSTFYLSSTKIADVSAEHNAAGLLHLYDTVVARPN